MMRSAAWLMELGLLTCVVGCVTGPLNGETFGGAIIGATFPYEGYTDTPNETITLEVLSRPNLDPGVSTNWVAFGTAVTSSTPTYINDPTPLYEWSTLATPVPTFAQSLRWAAGGVMRTRARRADGSILSTFDAPTYLECAAQHYSEGWQAIGQSCGGVTTKASGRVSGVAALASTSRTPLDLSPTLKPNWLGRKRDLSAAETTAYYSAWGAPDSLDAFKAAYGFAAGNVTATFYNQGDLGLGREMHCRSTSNGLNKIVACYVSNYSGVDGAPKFGVDPATVMNQMVTGGHPFATVAMVYKQPLVGLAPPRVDFVAYGADGAHQLVAQLDSTNAHSTIPSACLSCHGISSYFDSMTSTIVDPGAAPGEPPARFLAFDPFSYLYPGTAALTESAQREAFRKLNAMVLETRPAPATVDLINGMYAGAVTTPGAAPTNSYVPTGWAQADASWDGKAMYNGVIKIGCRTCHASASNPALDFLQLADWSPLGYQIRRLVCGKTSGIVRGHEMPNAEQVSKMFWKSGARALLLGYTQPYQALPGSPPTYPDPYASCDP